ncbi:MAG: hypothetical protein R3349_05130, partial [Geminicoccaceae bacterium]|nr:hypothetical protein [Geminicoccaceae bacterium]
PVGLLQLLGAQATVDLPKGLDRVSVIDGEVVIGALPGSALIVERVDLEVQAESERGPFFVEATFARAGEPFVLEGRLGRLTADPNTTVSFELATAPEASEQLEFGFQGIVSIDRLSAFRGQANLAGSRIDAALELLGPPGLVDRSVPLETAFAAAGTIEADDGHGEITNLEIRLGEVAGRGRLGYALTPPRRLELALDVPRVDTGELGFEPELLGAWAALERIPDGEIELSIATLVHEGSAVRDLRLTLDLEPGREIRLSQSRAVLPGETDLLVEGRIITGDEPSFDGRLSAVTDRLGEMLVWLDPSVSSDAADRFRTLVVEADVTARPGRIELAGLDGRLDASTVRGSVALSAGHRPKIAADLALDRLDLDRYLPDAAPDLIAGILLDRLRTNDLSLQLDLERLSAAGLRWSDVQVDADSRAGRLELERLRAGLFADTSLELGGAIDLARKEADLAAKVSSTKPGPLIRRLGHSPAFSLERLGDLEIEGTLDGWIDAASIDARATLGRLRSHAAGQAAIDDDGTLTLELDVDLLHPHYPELLADLSLGATEMADEPLAGAFKVRRQGDGKTGVIGNLGLGPSRITGQLDYLIDSGRTNVDARLSIAEPQTGALLPLLALGGYRLDALSVARSLPGAWPGLYLDVTPLRAVDGRFELSGKDAKGEIAFDALVTSDHGLLRLERGRLGLGTDAGELALQATVDVRGATPAVALVVEAADLAFGGMATDGASGAGIGGRLDLYGELRGTGFTLQDLIRSSSGDLALSIRDGEIARPLEASRSEVGATVSLDLLEAQLDVARGLGDLTRLDVETSDGVYTGQGLIDLLIWMVDLDLEERAGERLIEIVGPPGDLQVLVRDAAAAPAE